MTSVLIATRNGHKTSEIRAILGKRFTVSDLTGRTDIPEVDETGVTFLENATLKAVSGSQYFDGLVFADDSGLEVDALGGEPGVRSARYSDPRANDLRNLQLLLANLQGVASRQARFRCAVVIAKSGTVLASFEGFCEGTIIETPKGTDGFGYDPVFVPVGFTQTFAQLSSGAKNAISHRGKAVKKAIAWLQTEYGG